MRVFLTVLVSVFAISGCVRFLGKVKKGEGCTPGTSIECTCQSGETSAQVCQSDGKSYGECGCERKLVFLLGPPKVLPAGKTFSLHVVTTDSFGDIRDDETGRISLRLEGQGALDGEVLGRFDEGEATFSGLQVTQVQMDATIVATSRGQSVASEPFTVTTGEPAKLAWKNPLPSPVISGVPIDPVPELEVRDKYGNPTTPDGQLAVSIAVSDSLVGVAPTVVILDSAGGTVSDMRLTGAGTMVRVVASAGGLESAVSSIVEVQQIDPEWPSTRIPDSLTAFCGDGVQHRTSHCESVTPAGSMQDGARVSPMPDVVNSGGVLFDRITGLIWEATAGVTMPNVADAASRCASLTSGGLSWRLPTRWELVTLLDLGAVNQDTAFYAVTVTPLGEGWGINRNGTMFAAPGPMGLSSRCVSGPPLVTAQAGPPSGQYAPFTLASATIRDLRTHLEWQRATSVAPSTWAEALSACDSLVLDSRDDWRLPSLKEIFSLSDPRRTLPTFDPIAFPDGGIAPYYWSSTPVHLWAPGPLIFENGVWVIMSSDGRSDSVSATDGTRLFVGNTIPPPRVRCVRDE